MSWRRQSHEVTFAERCAQLQRLLSSTGLQWLMEAHNGLSAKVVEQAGFSAVWASGLSIASALGLRDANEATFSDILAVLELMADAVEIPILCDGDTGFGNFNNFRRVVSKLCQRGIAGVVIEDKLFPKMNSFVGDRHPLADVEEFCGKVRAGADTRSNNQFCIVARTEALIAGRSLSEALSRAEAYRCAGADAIFVHSKAKSAAEVHAFAIEWGRRCPLIIAPTTYYREDMSAIAQAGVTAVICANQNMRASVRAMREVSKRILAEQGLTGAETMIEPLSAIFEALEYPELEDAERKYLPAIAEPQGSADGVNALSTVMTRRSPSR